MGVGPSVDATKQETYDIFGNECGFRVQRIRPDSPCADVGLVSFCDYIVTADDVRLDSDDGSFGRQIESAKGRELRLCVFNAQTMRTREVTVVPSDACVCCDAR